MDKELIPLCFKCCHKITREAIGKRLFRYQEIIGCEYGDKPCPVTGVTASEAVKRYVNKEKTCT